MVICFLCKDSLDLKLLKDHYKLKHSNHEFVEYLCHEDECRRSFHLFSCYKRHLEKCHVPKSECGTSSRPSYIESDKLIESDNEIYHLIDTTSNQIDVVSSPVNLNSHCSTPVNSMDNVISTFIASLYGNKSLPRNVVQNVVDGFGECLSSLVPVIEQCVNKDSVKKTIHSENLTSLAESLTNEVRSEISSSLKNFTTEHKRLNYFKKQGSYIEPQAIVIGQRLNNVKNQGVSRLQPVECHAQFIPLRDLLNKFFSLNDILSETLQYMNSLNSKEEKENFIQGSYWQERMKHHSDRTVIPLFMYFDDYETGNVLGSHAGVHKLGAVYISIPCLPPWRSSALSNIFLILLFHSSDRIAFGNHVIFRSVINEFNHLSENGILFDMPTFKGKLYFELGVILGDNLGLHSMLGLVESFSANFSCRICKVTKSTLKEQCYEDISLLRNTDVYYRDLALNDPSLTGIRERCVFLDIKNFDMFQQVGLDIMHDILEGVAKYLISFILLKYTQTLQLFPLTLLNDKISSMDFGPDSKNRPCSIEKEHISRGTLRLSSGEMLTFLRFFGIIIGDYVPRNDCIWSLYIKLRKILDIVLSVKITVGTEDLLQVLVAEFNELYMQVTKDTLKPKFHFMVHYHSALKKFGPISSLWSMRFEGKHRESKMAAKVSFNQVNIALTLAIKHQLQLNEIFHRGSLNDILKLGPNKPVLPIEAECLRKQLNLDYSKPLIKVTWVMMSSIQYDKGCILAHSLNEEGHYIFMVAENIYLYDCNQLILSGKLLETIGFDEHYFAYQVKTQDTDVNYTLFYKSLLSPIPNTKNILPDGRQYVVIRSPL